MANGIIMKITRIRVTIRLRIRIGIRDPAWVSFPVP